MALWDSPPEPVWQKRFYDFNVWSERKRVEKLRYMHRNPVKRGLVEEPDQTQRVRVAHSFAKYANEWGTHRYLGHPAIQ